MTDAGRGREPSAPSTRIAGARSTPREPTSNALLLLVAVGFVVLAHRKFMGELRFEDALIVLRYARNLVAGEGMVFNPGERVLGVSTPLFTLLSTVFVAWDSARAVELQNLFGMVCLAVESILAGLLTRRLGYRYLSLPVQILVLCNFSLNYLYFGMEVHLYAALVLAIYLLLLAERTATLGVVLGIAFLVRYDAALLALLVGSVTWTRSRQPPVRMVLAFFIVVSPWLLFSWQYFGTIVPEPLHAKEGQTGFVHYLLHFGRNHTNMLESFGSLYVRPAWLFPWAVACTALAAVGGWRLIRTDSRCAVMVFYPALHTAVYAAIGADAGFTWHTYFVTPVFWLLLVIGTYESVCAVARRVGVERWETVLAAGMVLPILPALFHLRANLLSPYRVDPFTREQAQVAEWIDRRYPDTTSLMNPAIGILGWVTNMRIIDQAGLVTPGLRYHDYGDHRPRTRLRAAVREYRPDLVLLRENEDQALLGLGYRPVAGFDASPNYRLYERPGG
jgi:hypothetical protein